MNPHTLKRLSQVHPLLKQRAEIIIARMAERGITLEVVQGLRTAQEQNELYAQGRSKPGPKVTNAKAWQSFHCYGIAVDFCPFVDGKPDWNAPREVWNAIGAEAERLHLEWGGRWKFRDLPHVQLPGLSISQCFDLSKAGSLQPVWDRLSKIAEDFVILSPSVSFQGAKGIQAATPPQKRQEGTFPAQEIALPVSTPPDFQPSTPAFVPAEVTQSRAVESLKTGNTLPVLVSAFIAARDFLQQNYRWLILWAILCVLIALAIYELGPKLRRK